MSKPHSQIHMDREKEINGTRLSMDENNQLHVLFSDLVDQIIYTCLRYIRSLYFANINVPNIYTQKKNLFVILETNDNDQLNMGPLLHMHTM